MARIARRLVATSALATILCGAAAHAQTAAPAPAAVNPDAPAAALAEIVVTAQKRSQRLQDVPISMEVVSGQKLEAFHATDVKSVMNYTPNVFVESTAGNDVIYIRGFGSPPANFAFDQSVSLYVDGVYAGRSRQAQGPFFDLQRVEVARGPQGALFGKNTPAGAISIVSAGPTSTFQGDVNAAYNFGLKGYDIDGFVSGPLNDDWSARLAVRFLDQDGYIKNTFNGHMDPEDKQDLARLTLKYSPASGPLDYTVKVDYGHSQVFGGMNVSSALDLSQHPRTTRYADTTSPFGPEGQETDSLIVSGTGNLRLGDYTLTSVTAYSGFHSDMINVFDQTNPAGGLPTGNSVFNAFPEHFTQVSQEIRLLSPTGRKFEYVIGGYYDNSYYDLDQEQGFRIPGLYNGDEQTSFRQRAETLSAFAQGTYHVLDNLRLVGSLRFTETNKRAYFTGKFLDGGFVGGPAGPFQPLTNAKGKMGEGDVDPSITVQYDIARQVMVYATYGRGSKSGGFVSNTFGTTDATFSYKPERSENYELGIKSTLLDGALVFDAALYDTKFHDLQVSVFNSATQSYVTGNAASASSKGIEASASWRPIDNLDFNASMAYQDVRYDNYPGASCLATQANCDPTNPVSVAANNLKGYALPYTSKFTGSFQAHYRYDLPKDYRIDTTVNVAGRSRYYDSDDQDPLYGLQPGYAKVDLRVQFAPDSERWHLALVGKNLTDELTTGSAFNLPAPITTLPRAILYVEPGRNISIEAGIKF